MSKRVKAHPRASQVEMGSRVLKEFEQAQRRQYHERIRQNLVDRGAIVKTVEKLLEEAAPRFRDKGWRVTEQGSE
jgi:hypothetical protein